MVNLTHINAWGSSALSRRTALRAVLGFGICSARTRGFAQKPAASIPKVDLHHHFSATGPLKPFMSRIPNLRPILAYTPSQSIAAMDQAGVELAMLSCPISLGDDPALFRDAVVTTRALNDFGARMVSDHKGRFGLLAGLPLPQIEPSLSEIEYAFGALKCDGIAVKTSYGNRWLGDPAFQPVLDELNRRRAVVHVHPDVAPCCRDLIPDTDPMRIEFNTDTSRAIWTMIKDSDSAPSMASRYPNIRFIWSHAGGTLVGLVGRFLIGDESSAEALRHVPKPNSRLYHLRRFYYDTAASYNSVQMQALKMLVGTTQIVFGTDFPMAHITVVTNGLDQCGLNAQELRAVYRENALSILSKQR
jgi:predicted TIM-barrel fold metal-dependent hydrolase